MNVANKVIYKFYPYKLWDMISTCINSLINNILNYMSDCKSLEFLESWDKQINEDETVLYSLYIYF